MSLYSQNFVFNGLGTFSFSVPNAGPYVLRGKISIPTLVNGGGASGLGVVVNQNGSPVYTGQTGAEGFELDLSCAANDTIAVVLSSSAAPDQGLNVIKTVISISQGQ